MISVETVGTIIVSAVAGFGVGYALLTQSPKEVTSAPEAISKKKTSNGTVRNVLVCIAMEAEALPLIERLNLKNLSSIDSTAPCELYSGEYKGCTINVVTNGKDRRFGVDNVGTTPAALSTYLAIQKTNPDIIINAGTAGGFQAKGGRIGDIYISMYCMHHDRRVPIPKFLEYGKGDHKSFPVPNLARHLKCKTGNVTTSNSLDHTEKDDEMMLANDASVKDMEAAAVAWIAEITNTPMFAIKVVTDIVDGNRPTEEEFFENLQSAAHSMQDAVPKALDFIVGKRLLCSGKFNSLSPVMMALTLQRLLEEEDPPLSGTFLLTMAYYHK
eukprot:gene161-272_t